MRKKTYKQPLRQKQNGVALITALIITSVAVSFATLIIYRQQIQIRLSSNISTLEQNYQYAYGMEDFAGTILKRSFEDHPEYVSLNDDWYSETGLVLPITGGIMTGKLYDLQARINVNSLIRPKIEKLQSDLNNDNKLNSSGVVIGTGAGIPNPDVKKASNPDDETKIEYVNIANITKERLTRLISNIDTQQDMGPAESFTVNLRDWIDKDEENGKSALSDDDTDIGNGAETPYYQSLGPAYYSANSEIISPTGLRLIKNMQEKFYTAISKEISTLPTQFENKPTVTPINVNTASEIVLAALGFTPDAITNILELRKDEPFASLESFKTIRVVEDALITEANPDGLVDPLDLDVKSEYFLLEGKVEINNTRLFINSILWHKNGLVSVIMRDFSNPQTISKAVN